jgi:SAM-dependent methyltransferase
MTFGRLKDLVFSRIFRRQPRPATLLEYWEKRAREFGPRAVLDMRHAPEEDEAVTREQRRRLFPLLTRQLTGAERMVLDFGCGPGRFTGPLADLTGGQAIGVDPIQAFLATCPPRRLKSGVC